MPDDADAVRRQAIERAARGLTRAIVDLAEAVAMPREDAPALVAKPPRHPDDALTMAQVCEITGLSRSTFYNLRGKGEGPPFFVVRNRLRCYRSDLETWMTGRTNS
ncbi:helix-turn-helix transcriptional regulator [Microbacterium sp. NPDC007973]|uniref:helix-turn-helix transcriptional regulator n=1 Tax=Microbacterium sp. NPDC007973 TaxID=3364182 RepID=UPI0036EB50DC